MSFSAFGAALVACPESRAGAACKAAEARGA